MFFVAQKVDPTEQGVVPAFTRRRERIVGRLAMLGVAFAWAGEQLTGLGPLTQISNETGVPMQYVYGATVFLAATQLILGVNQFSPTYDEANQRDVNKRKKGITGITAIEPDVEGRIKITEQPGKFFLRNELVLGRSAMLSELRQTPHAFQVRRLPHICSPMHAERHQLLNKEQFIDAILSSIGLLTLN